MVPTPHAFSDAQISVLRFNFTVASGGLLVVLAGISLGLARHQIHRLEAEQLVRLSEARLRAVTETASDAIISADRQGIVRYFNPGAEKAFGHAEQDIVGQPLTELMPDRFRQRHTEGFQRYLETRDPKVVGQTVELVGLRKDGREFPIELALASSEVDGELFFTAIVRDITKRAEAEREIQDLNRRLQLDNAELEAVNKELEAFSYSVSHDLRAPLRAIDGFSQALVEDAGPLLKPEHHSHLNRVRQAAQRMGVLIDDLLKLARVTRTDVNIDDVDLSEIALDARDQPSGFRPGTPGRVRDRAGRAGRGRPAADAGRPGQPAGQCLEVHRPALAGPDRVRHDGRRTASRPFSCATTASDST